MTPERLKEISDKAAEKWRDQDCQEAYLQGAEYADSHPVNQWHKVEDELPPKVNQESKYSDYVIVTDRQIRGVARYNHIINKWLFDSATWMCEVTHWMPLPELPKEE